MKLNYKPEPPEHVYRPHMSDLKVGDIFMYCNDVHINIGAVGRLDITALKRTDAGWVIINYSDAEIQVLFPEAELILGRSKDLFKQEVTQ